MAKITINTTDPEYLALETQFDELRSAMRARIKLYQRLTSAQKNQWLKKDKLMRKVFNWSERLANGKNDD